MPIQLSATQNHSEFFREERRAYGGQYAARSIDGLTTYGYAPTWVGLEQVATAAGQDFREVIVDYVPHEGETCVTPSGVFEPIEGD